MQLGAGGCILQGCILHLGGLAGCLWGPLDAGRGVPHLAGCARCSWGLVDASGGAAFNILVVSLDASGDHWMQGGAVLDAAGLTRILQGAPDAAGGWWMQLEGQLDASGGLRMWPGPKLVAFNKGQPRTTAQPRRTPAIAPATPSGIVGPFLNPTSCRPRCDDPAVSHPERHPTTKMWPRCQGVATVAGRRLWGRTLVRSRAGFRVLGF